MRYFEQKIQVSYFRLFTVKFPINTHAELLGCAKTFIGLFDNISFLLYQTQEVSKLAPTLLLLIVKDELDTCVMITTEGK